MTYQQRAIEFFSNTGEEWWMKNQIVEKLRELAEDPSEADLTYRLNIHSDTIDRIIRRLSVLEKNQNSPDLPTLKPEISSLPDDDAPF